MRGRTPHPLTRPEVFTAFYREHIEAMLRFVTRRVDDPHVAADITAEVFSAVITSAGTYREDRGSPLAWLYGIARNHIAGETRRRARDTAGRQRLAGRRLLDDDDLGRMEERIDADRAARALYHRLLRLPGAERAVLELVAVDGLTVAEAAHALQIRPGAARARLFRARRALTAESRASGGTTMNAEPSASFEDRLLEQLQDQLAEPGSVRRRRWLVVTAAATAVAAVTAAVVGTAAAQPAYAIRTASDGALLITFTSTDAEDVARAEADLQRRGVRIELVATTHDCLGVLGAAPLPSPPHPLPSGPPSRDNMPALYAFDALPGNDTYAVRPDVVPAGHALWVAIADNGTNLVTVSDFRPLGSTQPDFCG